MATSHMNYSLHSGIIQAIVNPCVARASGRRYFANTLEQIISDFQDQITVDATRAQDASASRVGRRPEALVLDSWCVWQHDRNHAGCWWVNCSHRATLELIEKIFDRWGLAADPPRRRYNITWGTLLRYFEFIHSEICGNTEGADVVAALSLPQLVRSIVDKFNNEEEESMNTLTGERAKELGYVIGPVLPGAHAQQRGPGPTPEPTPEPTTTQSNNASLRKLRDIIDSVSRGEKPELNEGEYLQLSDYLKRSFVSQ